MFSQFKILRNRNYALYFFGQLLSMAGSWMQAMVQGWLVYRLSHSAAWLGAITFFSQVPAFLLAPVAGVVADRRDRRKILIWVQVVAMVQAFLLTTLVFLNIVRLWEIAVLASFLGVITAFDMTTRQAFTVDMVEKHDVPHVVTLNSLIFNSARIVGPALAGVLIGLIGEGWCFFLNGLSFLAVIYGLLAMKIRKVERTPPRFAHPWHQIQEALRYVRGNREIRSLMAIAAFVAFVSAPYSVLLPAIAKDLLHGDARTLGWLSVAGGLGAVLGGLTSTGISREGGSVLRRLVARVVLMGFAMIGMGYSTSLVPSLATLFLAGFFIMNVFPAINTRIQQAVQSAMRGRVLSLYTMSFLGAAPLGGVLAGAFAGRLGVQPVLIGAGMISVGFGLLAGVRWER